jgi:enoyl-CoA hydratase/carnithine racemase
MTPYLHTSVDGAVATLLIDRPAKRNAISLEMWGSLPALVDDVCSDPEIRVLIITGAHPGVFSAGADIGEFPGLRSEVPAGRHYSATIRAGQRAVAGARVPTIAAISGSCLGGGCGLALACDLRIADVTVRLGIPAARLGVVYSLPSTKRLVDVVGPAWAKQILLTADAVDADTALRIGLVNEVHPPDALWPRVRTLAARIAARSGLSVESSKAIVNRVVAGQDADDEHCQSIYDASYVAAEYQAGVAAFLGKRANIAEAP